MLCPYVQFRSNNLPHLVVVHPIYDGGPSSAIGAMRF